MRKFCGKNELIFLLLLSCLVGVAFGKTYHNQFLGMDDHAFVWDNPYIRDGLTLEGIIWAFQADLTKPSEFADYWQPVTFISRMIDISLFKFNAGAHHVVNLLFHIANVWLLYFFLRRLTSSNTASLWITSLFALHPLHAEIIGWITARKDVLSIFFGLITIHIYYWRKESNNFVRTIIFALSFALSLMAKPMVITLPVVLILLDLYERLENQKTISIKEIWMSGLDKWPLFLMVALYLPIPFLGQPQAFEYDINHPVVKGIVAYLFYIQKILMPLDLSLYGPIPEPKIALSTFLFSLAGVVFITVISFLMRKKTWMILLGWGWFLVTTLPIIGLTWVADRFVYFPMIGILIIFVYMLKSYIKNKDAIASIIVLFVIFFTIQSFNQISVWKNDETLMLRALEYSNENYSAHNVLGVFYAKEADDEEKALYHLKEAIRIRPDRDKPYNNIGRILEQNGKHDEAVQYYEKSLALNANDFRTLNNLGIVYVREGKYKKGIEYFTRALAINPKAIDTHNNLAIAYFRSGSIAQAESIAAQTQSAYLYNQFGLFLAAEKKYNEARRYFERALAIDPNFPKTRDYLNQINAHVNN